MIEFQLSYFISLKMMLWKCCNQYVIKSGKFSSGHRTGRGQFSFQSQRKVITKNAQTTTQFHSSHRLVKKCSKFSKPGFRSIWTVIFQILKLVLEVRGTRDQIFNIHWIVKKKARNFQKNIYFCFIDSAKYFDCVDHNKLWKILKDMRIPDHQTCLLRNLYAVQEATIRTGPGTTDLFQIRKGVCQGWILSPCLLNYIQSTLWEMLGWRNHKLESRLPGEISITPDMQMTPSLRQKVKKN